MLYYGEYHLTIDEKGRVPVPSKFRTVMQNNNSQTEEWVLTKGLEHSLLLYPLHRWKDVVEELNHRLSYSAF